MAAQEYKRHSARIMMIFAPHHTAVLAQRIAAIIGQPLSASEEREFDGGEHKMRPLVEVRGQDVFVVQSLCGDRLATANDKLCRLLFFLATLQDAGAARVTACVPYLCYARKDRRTQARDPVTTRYLAALFEAVRVDRVLVLDVHNEAAFDNAFRCETLRLQAAAQFADTLTGSLPSSPLVVVSPDVGGVKRAQQLRELLANKAQRNIEFAFMEKRRAAGVVSGETLTGDVHDGEVLIFDDLIASGTTILRATAAARRAGARTVRVIATHAAFLPDATQLFNEDGPDEVLVSDSIALQSSFQQWVGGRLHVCSIAPLFARAIEELAR